MEEKHGEAETDRGQCLDLQGDLTENAAGYSRVWEVAIHGVHRACIHRQPQVGAVLSKLKNTGQHCGCHGPEFPE